MSSSRRASRAARPRSPRRAGNPAVRGRGPSPARPAVELPQALAIPAAARSASSVSAARSWRPTAGSAHVPRQPSPRPRRRAGCSRRASPSALRSTYEGGTRFARLVERVEPGGPPVMTPVVLAGQRVLLAGVALALLRWRAAAANATSHRRSASPLPVTVVDARRQTMTLDRGRSASRRWTPGLRASWPRRRAGARPVKVCKIRRPCASPTANADSCCTSAVDSGAEHQSSSTSRHRLDQ